MGILFAELVRHYDSPHCSKTPTDTFRAVVAALDELAHANTNEIARYARRQWTPVDCVLTRLRRYDCATLSRGAPGLQGQCGREWTITDQGRILARDLQEH